MLQLRAGAALIDLVDIAAEEGAWARPPAAGGRNMDHVCLATGPWDEAAMRAHLAAHDVAIVEEGIRYGARGDGLSFYVSGPVRQRDRAQGTFLSPARPRVSRSWPPNPPRRRPSRPGRRPKSPRRRPTSTSLVAGPPAAAGPPQPQP